MSTTDKLTDKKPKDETFKLTKIDLNNKELVRALEKLPTTEQFISNMNHHEFIIPNLREIHHIIHELLPKPNKGLWEPQFNLDPFILSYMALQYQNRDKKQQVMNNNSNNIDDDKLSEKTVDETFRISKL